MNVREIPNTQWQFIIIDLEGGDVKGTNDEKVANEFAQSEYSVVIERNTCKVREGFRDLSTAEPNDINIPEQELYKF